MTHAFRTVWDGERIVAVSPESGEGEETPSDDRTKSRVFDFALIVLMKLL